MMPSDREQFSELIDDAFLAFSCVPLPGAKEQFWRVLQKFGIATLQKAVMKWVTNEEKPPTPAAIRRLAFDVAIHANETEGDEDVVMIERVYAYAQPETARNKKGNTHGITLPESIARRRLGELAEAYERRITDAVTQGMYANLARQFQQQERREIEHNGPTPTTAGPKRRSRCVRCADEGCWWCQ